MVFRGVYHAEQAIENYLHFWKHLEGIYNLFNSNLLKQNLGHQGLIYKSAVKQLPRYLKTANKKGAVNKNATKYAPALNTRFKANDRTAGKGFGGGMPLGAFISSKEIFKVLQDNPVLGHITTFGGHPVVAASALATLQEIINSDLMQQAIRKEKLIRKLLVHPLIKEIRGKGLMLALITPSADITNTLILKSQDAGLILFWLLFEPKAVRITPPLTISDEEIAKGCAIIIDVLNDLQ